MSKRMTPAQKRFMRKLEKFGRVLVQHEGKETLFGFDCGPLVNMRTFNCLLRDGRIEPSEFGLDDAPLAYSAKDVK